MEGEKEKKLSRGFFLQEKGGEALLLCGWSYRRNV